MSARIDLNHKIHVLTKKEELDSVRIPGKVIVVLDILFATSTMVTALAHGASDIVPVLDEATARSSGWEAPPICWRWSSPPGSTRFPSSRRSTPAACASLPSFARGALPRFARALR
jgi:2-phosphosulfolactate phosphatase